MSSLMKEWRGRMGFTQRDAADKLGVTLQTYQDIESGKTMATGNARELDTRTALACAAIEYGVKPIDSQEYKAKRMKKFRNFAGGVSLNNINIGVYETDESGEHLLLIAERVATGRQVKGTSTAIITKERYDELDSDQCNELVRYKAAAALCGLDV